MEWHFGGQLNHQTNPFRITNWISLIRNQIFKEIWFVKIEPFCSLGGRRWNEIFFLRATHKSNSAPQCNDWIFSFKSDIEKFMSDILKTCATMILCFLRIFILKSSFCGLWYTHSKKLWLKIMKHVNFQFKAKLLIKLVTEDYFKHYCRCRLLTLLRVGFTLSKRGGPIKEDWQSP